MASIKSFPNNQDEFIGAEAVMKWLHGRTSGVFAAGGQCAVAAVADSMSVTVSDGNGWMSNSEGDGIVWWISSEKDTGTKLTLTADMADATMPRIDRAVVSWQTTNYVALPEVKILRGAPASNPMPPALTNNNIMRQISLARIRIPAGATAITASMITDERLDPAACGLVTESVKVDTSVINAQLLAAYQEYTRNMDKYTTEARADFEAWFQAVKDALSGDVAGNLKNQIDELRAGVDNLKSLQFFTTTVPISAFSADATYPDYPCRAAVALAGVVAFMIPSVTYSIPDAVGGNFAPGAESYDGGIYIYAASVPEGDVVIPTIVCTRRAT